MTTQLNSERISAPNMRKNLSIYLLILLAVALVESKQVQFDPKIQTWFWQTYFAISVGATVFLAHTFSSWWLKISAVLVSAIIYLNIAFLDRHLAAQEFEEVCQKKARIFAKEEIHLAKSELNPETGLPNFYMPTSNRYGLEETSYKFDFLNEQRYFGSWGRYDISILQLRTNDGRVLAEANNPYWAGGGAPALQFQVPRTACPNVFTHSDLVRAVFGG